MVILVIYVLQYGTCKTLAAWNQQNSCSPRWYHYCPADISRIESHRVLIIWSTDTPSLQLLHLGDRELYWRSVRPWAASVWTCCGDCNSISSCKKCLCIQQNDIAQWNPHEIKLASECCVPDFPYQGEVPKIALSLVRLDQTVSSFRHRLQG